MLSINLNHFPLLADSTRHRLLSMARLVASAEGPVQLPARRTSSSAETQLFQHESNSVRLRDIGYAAMAGSDKSVVRLKMPDRDCGRSMSIPWAMEMKAVSIEEPSRLVQMLSGAILGCGGWILSRGADDSGTVNLLFEFERQACVDIYSVMIAAGLELSQSGHIRITELCQCTRSNKRQCGTEIASIDLEIQTFPVERVRRPSVNEAA